MERHGSRLSRREFVVGAAGLGLLAGCGRLPWQGQPPTVPRVGFTRARRHGWRPRITRPSEQGCASWATWKTRTSCSNRDSQRRPLSSYPPLATELVRLPVDVILVVGGGRRHRRPAIEATETIPIVLVHRE